MNDRDQIGSSAMKNAAESPNGDRGTVVSSPMSKQRHTLKQCVALTAYIVSAWIVFLGIANKSEMQYKFGGTVWQISSQQTNPTNNALIANSIIPDPKTKRNNSLKINNNKKFRNISQDEVDPPYEKLWPKYVLPMWARKSVNYEVPSEESICFVHVGKAGGSAGECTKTGVMHAMIDLE